MTEKTRNKVGNTIAAILWVIVILVLTQAFTGIAG